MRPMKNAFFEFFLREVSTTRPPALSIYPRGGDPSPPAHPDGLHSTDSSADRARCKADRPQQAEHRNTRPDTGHAALVCTRYQTGCAGQIGTAAGAGGLAVCPANYTFSDVKYFPCECV